MELPFIEMEKAGKGSLEMKTRIIMFNLGVFGSV